LEGLLPRLLSLHIEAVVQGEKSEGRRALEQAITHFNREISVIRISYESQIAELRRSKEREIAELTSSHKEHLRTCPAPKNELMLEQGESSTFADVCVVAGESVFHVHRSILASRYGTVRYATALYCTKQYTSNLPCFGAQYANSHPCWYAGGPCNKEGSMSAHHWFTMVRFVCHCPAVSLSTTLSTSYVTASVCVTIST